MVRTLGARQAIGSFGLCALLAGCGGGGNPAAAPSSTVKPTQTTQSLKLPVFTAAQQTACVNDFQTLKEVENLYKTVNGTYATLDTLIAEQYIQAPLTYFTGIKIGTPVGGYTLIAAPDGPCASLPVRDL